MIINIIGGLGSGKTLTAVKSSIEDFDNKIKIFCNFNIEIPHEKISFQELKDNDIRTEEGKQYWLNKFSGIDLAIYIDEATNWLDARTSMSKNNQIVTAWLSQIRKMLGSSETSHLYLISQLKKQLDVRSRDLTHITIRCGKKIKGKFKFKEKGKLIIQDKIIITNIFYLHEMNKVIKTNFIGNPYFNYFDTHEIIN